MLVRYLMGLSLTLAASSSLAQVGNKARPGATRPATVTTRSNADVDRDVKIRDRYLSLALKNPRHGTVLEKLYQSGVQTDGIDALLERVKRRSSEAGAVACWTLIGLLEETRGRDAAALVALERATAADAKAAYAWFARGTILLHRSDYKAAAASLLKAIEAKPSREDTIEVRKALGRCYLRSRQTDKARETWLALSQIAPQDAVTLEELATLLIEEEQWPEAIIYLEQLRKLQKDRPYQLVQTTIRMGNVEARRGKFAEALARYEEALTRTKSDSWLAGEIRGRVESLFRKRNDLTGLVEYYEKRLADADAGNVRTMVALARVLVELNRGKDARGWYERALSLAPKDEAVRLAYVRLLEIEKDFVAAIRQYETLLAQKPKEVAYLEALGDLHLRQAQDDPAKAKARSCWEKIAQANPKDPASMVQVAGIFHDHGMDDDAARYFQRAIELAPDVGQYREYYGEFLIKTKQSDQALAAFKEIAAGPRKSVETLMRLADVLTHFEFAAEALAASREAVALDADHFEARTQLVKLLAAREDYDEALEQLDAAAKLAPNDYFKAQVIDDRIRLLSRAKRLAETFDKRTAELAKAPSADAAAYVECAKMALALSRLEPAAEFIGKALAKSPDSVPVCEVAASVYSRAGDHLRLVAMLERLIELAPQNRVEYYTRLARHYQRVGDSQAAIGAAKQVIDASPDGPDGYELLATISERFGMNDESVTVLKKAVRINPRNLALRMLYARRLDRSDRADLAIEQFWQAYDAQTDAADKLSVMRSLADVAYRSGDFDKLVDRLERRRRMDRDAWVPTLSLAAAYRQIEDYAKAREALTTLLPKRPNDADLLKQLVHLSEAEGLNEQAVEHLQRLVKLEPSRQNLMRLGERLCDLDRTAEALDAWRRAGRSGDDPARATTEVTEKLLERQMYEPALEFLGGAFKDHPDDWRIGYRYGLALMGAKRADEADKVFLHVADLPDLPPANKPKATPKQKTPASPSSVYYSRLPAEMRRVRMLYQMRYQLSPRYRRSLSSGRGSLYVPSDLDECRLAAWYQHCEIVIKRDGLDALVAALKKDGTPKALWRLISLLGTQDRWRREIHEVAKALCAAAPDDMAARLLRFQLLMDRRGGEVEKAPFEEVKKLYEAVTAARPDLEMYVSSGWLHYLKQAERTDEMKAYAKKLVEAEYTDVMGVMMAVHAAVRTEDLDASLKLLKRGEARFGKGPHQAGGQGYSWYQAYAIVARLAANQDKPALAAKLFAQYLRLSRPPSSKLVRSSTAYSSGYPTMWGRVEAFPNATAYYDRQRLSVLEQFYRMTKGELETRRLTTRIAHTARTATRPAASRPAATSPAKPPPALVAMRKRFKDDLASGSEEDQVYAHLALAYFDWWDDQKDDAGKHVAAAVKLRPWDLSLRMSLAQLRHGLGDHKGTLEALSGIRRQYHPLYKPAQQLMLKAARELGDAEATKTVALRLFSMRLTPQEQLQLAATLHEFGLGKQAEQLEQRVRRVSGQDLNQLVQLMRQQHSRGAKAEAAELARQILNHLGKATMNQQHYRDSALQVLRDSGDLDKLIAKAERQRKENPEAVRVVIDLWHYYTAKQDHDSARECAERALELRPGDTSLRMQYAGALSRRGQHDQALRQYKLIFEKEPSKLFQSNAWEVVNAFRQAKKLGELANALVGQDWNKMALAAGPQPHQMISMLVDLARNLERDKVADVLPFLNKLNDFIIEAGQSGYGLGYVAKRRWELLREQGREWEGFRYLLAFSKTFSDLTLETPHAPPSSQMTKPLGVKTLAGDMLTTMRSYSQGGSPQGLVWDILNAAASLGQLQAMRTHVEAKLADRPNDLPLLVWRAMLDCQLERDETVREAIPKVLDMVRKRRASYQMVLWLDEAVKRRPPLLKDSLVCCEYLLEQTQKQQYGHMASTFYYRLAERYVQAGETEKGRAVFYRLAELSPPSHYTGVSATQEKDRYVLEAAKGCQRTGLDADAYALAIGLAKREPSGDGRRHGGYRMQEARQLVEQIVKKHPELSTPLEIVALPAAEDAVEIIWSPRVGDTQAIGRDCQYTATIVKQQAVFSGYRAEIQVGLRASGPFRRLAVVPAEQQQFRHEKLPASKVLWYRVVLHTAEGQVAAVSQEVPAAAGKNLAPDGGMERVPLGTITTDPDNEKQTWQVTDYRHKPASGFECVKESRPFSSGSRAIACKRTSSHMFVGSLPVAANPTKEYLIGGWIRVINGQGMLATASLNGEKQELIVYQSAYVRRSPRWTFCMHRLAFDSSMHVRVREGHRSMQMRGDNLRPLGMPAVQKYLRVGFTSSGEAAFDDAFLIEVTLADAAIIASLPEAEKVELHEEAAAAFARRVAERPSSVEAMSLLVAVPSGDNALQLVWGSQPKALDGTTRDDAMRVRVRREAALFKPYRAEIQVAPSPFAPYRVIDRVRADAQHYVHKRAPRNVLMWYRLALEDEDGKLAAVSRPVPGVAGKNLFPDGWVERDTRGMDVTDAAGLTRFWRGSSVALQPREGVSIVDGARPFSNGKRCLAARGGGSDLASLLLVRGKEVPVDLKKTYLYGAWVRVAAGEVATGRLALNGGRDAILGSEAWGATAGQTTDWSCVVQRLRADFSLNPQPSLPPAIRDLRGTDLMPGNQRYLLPAFLVSGDAMIDDAFLVEYRPAEEYVSSQWKPAGPLQYDVAAAKAFKERLASFEERPRPKAR